MSELPPLLPELESGGALVDWLLSPAPAALFTDWQAWIRAVTPPFDQRRDLTIDRPHLRGGPADQAAFRGYNTALHNWSQPWYLADAPKPLVLDRLGRPTIADPVTELAYAAFGRHAWRAARRRGLVGSVEEARSWSQSVDQWAPHALEHYRRVATLPVLHGEVWSQPWVDTSQQPSAPRRPAPVGRW